MTVNPIKEIESQLKNVRIIEAPKECEKSTDQCISKAKSIKDDVSCCRFEYKSENNTISGFLSFPKNISSKLPVIIYNRGGSFDFGLVDDKFLFTFLSKLASWGYFVIGTQYPGNSSGEGVDKFGGSSDVHSVLDLKNVIGTLSFIDKKRIGMLGHSRGGMMTYLCMKQVDWIKTALTIGGLSDLERCGNLRPEMNDVYKQAFGSTETGKIDRSVLHWVGKLSKSTSLCLMHGGSDARVSPKDSIELGKKLEEIEYSYSLHIVEDGNHYLTNKRDTSEKIMKNWFATNL